MADDFFGFLDANVPKALTAPAGYEAIHRPGNSWARQGDRLGNTSWISPAQWNHLIAQFRGLATVPGVDLSDVLPASPLLLREAMLRSIMAVLSIEEIGGYGLLDKATYDPNGDGVFALGQGGTGFAATDAADLRGKLGITAAISDAISTAIGSLVDSSPAALDTLNELASALGDDANFAATMTAALAARLRVDASQVLTLVQQGTAQANLGSYGCSIDAKSANYTVLVADNGKVITVDASGGARTIALPPAATAGGGFKLIVKKIDSSANAVTIDPDGTELVDGASTKTLRLAQQSTALICDGATWRVLSEATIFERGSNANGQYELFSDGTANCWNSGISGAPTNVSTGTGLFVGSSDDAVIFPIAFASIGAVIPSTGFANRWIGGAFNLTNSGFSFRAVSYASSATAIAMCYFATGRWF